MHLIRMFDHRPLRPLVPSAIPDELCVAEHLEGCFVRKYGMVPPVLGMVKSSLLPCLNVDGLEKRGCDRATHNIPELLRKVPLDGSGGDGKARMGLL